MPVQIQNVEWWVTYKNNRELPYEGDFEYKEDWPHIHKVNADYLSVNQLAVFHILCETRVILQHNTVPCLQ